MIPLDHWAAVRKVMGKRKMPDAIDFSSFTEIPTPLQIDELKAHGVWRAVIGTRGNRRKFVDQARACLSGGLEVQAYIYLYWNEGGTVQAMNAKALIEQVPEIKAVWLDVEADKDNPAVNDPAATLAAAWTVVRNYRCGIYTSRSMWPAVIGGSSWANFPLWSAGDGEFIPYGGWTERVMHQYRLDTTLAGLNVDLNMVEGRMKYTDEKLDEVIANLGQTLSAKADDTKVNDLANAVDELPATKRGLRFLWAAAAKAWPFGP